VQLQVTVLRCCCWLLCVNLLLCQWQDVLCSCLASHLRHRHVCVLHAGPVEGSRCATPTTSTARLQPHDACYCFLRPPNLYLLLQMHVLRLAVQVLS
jgi:hypothetical protein